METLFLLVLSNDIEKALDKRLLENTSVLFYSTKHPLGQLKVHDLQSALNV